MEIKIYGTEHCPKCKALKQRLMLKGIDYEYIIDQAKVLEAGRKYGADTTPIVVIDGKSVDYLEAVKMFK